MESMHVTSESDFLQQLRDIDISVPLRTQGRKTEHCERWSICRLLSTLAEARMLHFPLKLEKSERPDFVLTMSEIKIGIELTEAVSQMAMRIAAHREKQGYGGFLPLLRTPLSKGMPSRKELNRKKLDEIARGRVWGSGWSGDEPQLHWLEDMVHVSQSKAKSFMKPGFQRFTLNWLLIYDNLDLP